jgi:hypothetical protein
MFGSYYTIPVSTLEHIVEDLKKLPPPKLEQAADFIHRLTPVSPEIRQAALDRTFGCMTPEEADAFQRIIDEGCEQVDERDW